MRIIRLIQGALAVGCVLVGVPITAAPALVLLKSTIDFGKKVPGEPGANWMEAGYSNLGDQTLIFAGAGISIEGMDAGDFRFRDVPTTTPMGGTRYVNLEFAPESVGSKQAQLVFTTNDPDDPTTSILLTGEAVPFRGTLVNGAYDGYGPGNSTVGAGGDYASLADAVTAINAHPLTGGDWSFLILNDLNEPGSLLIGQPNTSSNTITLRPAPNTNPTVTFTSTTNQINSVTVSGHIIVGSKIERRWPNPPRLLPVRMQNFVIDGCNTVGGSERNLTLTNVDGLGSLMMVHIMGDADRVAIRNCKFACYALPPGSSSIYNNVVKFLGTESHLATAFGTSWGSPDYGEVLNCDFQTTGIYESVISYNSTDVSPMSHMSGYVVASNFRIAGNIINARGGSGVIVGMADTGEITSNSIVILDPGAGRFNIIKSGIWVSASIWPGNVTASVQIKSNAVTFVRSAVSAGSGETGILARTTLGNVDFDITNNAVSGVLAPNGSYAPGLGYGIVANINQGSTATIAHNSVAMCYMLGHQPTTATYCAALYLQRPNNGVYGKISISNNILYTNIPNSGCVVSNIPIGQNFQSDYNDLVYLNSAVAGFNGAGSYATISDWQTAVGQDGNSVNQDPFVPAIPGAGVWVGPSDSGSPNLHFTVHPGAVYKVPQLAGITTDIDGNVRPENYTLMGAHQPPGPPATVSGWGLY